MTFFPIVSSESPVARQTYSLLDDTLSRKKERERERETHFLFRSEVESSTRSFRVAGRVSRDVSRGVENQSGTGVERHCRRVCRDEKNDGSRRKRKTTGSRREMNSPEKNAP